MSKNDFAQLLESGEGLTEQFKTDATKLFEQAVEARVDEEVDKRVSLIVKNTLNEQLQQRLDEQKAQLIEQFADTTDEFVNEEVEKRFNDRVSQMIEQFADTVNDIVDEEIEKRVSEVRDSITGEYTEQYDQLIAQNQRLEEQMQADAADFAKFSVAKLRHKLASYADYVAEQYVENHHDDVVSETKVWLAEGIMESVRNLFAQYGIGAEEADQSYTKQITQLTEERDHAYAELAETLEKKFELEEQLNRSNKAAAFDQLTEGLAETDKARIKALMEGDTSDLETYKTRVQTLTESFAKSAQQDAAPAVSTINVVTESAPVNKVEKPAGPRATDPEVDMIARMLASGRGDHY